MTLMRRSLLSLFLCIALVLTLLPLIGAAEPAAATRGYLHGTITAADYAPASIPIRGITVFVSRADGTYSVTLRTNESGMYQSGTIDDRGVGFSVQANRPDKAGYNARYGSASYDNVLFAVNDRDGERRDFALPRSASGTPTPTDTPSSTPTPVPVTTAATLTPTPVPVTTAATPAAATPTPGGSGDETADAVEPDSPASSGWIEGTIRLQENGCSGGGCATLNGIPVLVVYKDGTGVERRKTCYTGQVCYSGAVPAPGYFNTGGIDTLQPYSITANSAGDSPYTSITRSGQTLNNGANTQNFYLQRKGSSPPPSNKVTLTVRVTNKDGYLLGGVPVYFWRKDGVSTTVRTGSDRNDDPNFGIAKLEVDRYDGDCVSGSKCYNIMANKWDIPNYPQHPDYFNSTDKTNVKPNGPQSVYFTLPSSTVTLKGYVYADNKPIKGIVVYLWNHDRKTEYGPVTNDKGEWSQVVPRWVWDGTNGRDDRRFNIVANKAGTKYPYNDQYTTSAETPQTQNILPSEDRSWGLNLNIESRFVTLGGKVTDSSGRAISGIYVYFWRQDGKQDFHAITGSSGQYTSYGIERVEKYNGPCGDGSKCFNIAFNKDDIHYLEKPKKPDYETREQSNIAPSYSRDNINQRLDSGWVYIDGRVSNTTGAYVKDIWVSGKRLDDRASFLAKTDRNGYWISRVEKFSEADHRFTVVANPPDHRNAWYLNSTPDIVQPSWNRSSNPKLVVSQVTYTGRVTANGKGVPNIPVTFERSDGRAKKYAWTSGEDGRYSIQLDSSTDYRDKFTITANKGGQGYPRNTAYDISNPQTGSADRNQENYYFSLKMVTSPTTPPVPTTPPTPVPTITPVPPTPNPGELRVNQAAAMMVSPDELGVAAKILFPSGDYGNKKREVTIETSLRDRNGNPVKKTFDLTASTAPGSEWGGQYFRTEYGRTVVKPSTPLRINLRDFGVSRFTDDTTITISVTASYGSVSTRPFPTTATVLLPTILYHGYLDPKIRNWLEVVEIAAYRPTSDFLVEKGYNKADAWTGDDAAELSRKGYSLRRYLTLMDPDMGVTYTTAEEATPDILRRDVDRTVNQAISSSYASRVNLIGHSTGGLVSFYYASVEPSKVARVITVGTPHQGVSEIYNKAFAPDIGSREEAENLLKVQEGAYRGQENTIKWFIPKYTDALEVPPDYVAGRDPSPYFTSTFTFSARSQVDYHYIYSSSHDDTLKTLVLEKNADGRWYHVKETKTGDGDHTVLAKSASNQGVTATNIHKYPVNIWYRHAVMFRESSVHDAILSALKHAPASPFRDETANDR